jgi:hypothetical protein
MHELYFNSVSMSYTDGTIKTFAEVKYDGTVVLDTLNMFQSSCYFDMSQMPFDTQVCHVEFSSQTMDISKVCMSMNSTDKLVKK